MTGLATLCGEGGVAAGHLVVSQGRMCFAVQPPGDDSDGAGAVGVGSSTRFLVEAACEARAKEEQLCKTLLRGHHVLAVRTALRQEICLGLRSLVAALRGKPPSLELKPARDDYDPRLTFSALDVFLAATAPTEWDPADVAYRVFVEYREEADAALLFDRTSGAAGHSLPVPVAACGLEDASLTAVVSLGRAALGIAIAFGRPSWGGSTHLMSFNSRSAIWVCVLSERNLALIRTDAQFGAGQVLGFATALVNRPGRSAPPA